MIKNLLVKITHFTINILIYFCFVYIYGFININKIDLNDSIDIYHKISKH